ncbi:MAG TPA: sugar phosphate isomerase/epimerase family protein, partial [Oscillospiraceae bacterium]|nr:sugar phosphate isomerase/epimerase family protein [Oscillospiraceae bacterium]
MKIAFSTLGCPEWSWQDIYTMAKDIGFDGIEVRGLGDETIAMKAGPFTDSQLDKTMAKLSSIGLEIPCFSSGCCLKLSDKLDSTKAELIQYMSLCKRTGTPYLRVLADLEPHCCGEVDDDAIAAVLKELVPVAKENNVTLLIETNGVYADTARLRTLLDSVASDNVAALWDLHHPYRFMNEEPKTTAANLGSYIKYVHIKDSIIVDGAVKYRMLGEGDMPIADMIDALKDIGY